jgi:hypothetical protein
VGRLTRVDTWLPDLLKTCAPPAGSYYYRPLYHVDTGPIETYLI